MKITLFERIRKPWDPKAQALIFFGSLLVGHLALSNPHKGEFFGVMKEPGYLRALWFSWGIAFIVTQCIYLMYIVIHLKYPKSVDPKRFRTARFWLGCFVPTTLSVGLAAGYFYFFTPYKNIFTNTIYFGQIFIIVVLFVIIGNVVFERFFWVRYDEENDPADSIVDPDPDKGGVTVTNQPDPEFVDDRPERGEVVKIDPDESFLQFQYINIRAEGVLGIFINGGSEYLSGSSSAVIARMPGDFFNNFKFQYVNMRNVVSIFFDVQEGTFHLVLNTGASLLTIARRRVKEIDDLCKKYKLTITNGEQVRKRGRPAKKQDQFRVTPA